MRDVDAHDTHDQTLRQMWKCLRIRCHDCQSTVPFLERLGGTGGTSSGEEDRAQEHSEAYDGT